MTNVRTRSTSSKHVRGYKADPEDNNDDDDFYGMRELKHQLAGLNLQLKDTMGDGNCLFRACSDQFYGNEGNHASLRADVCQYIEDHADHFNAFLDNETVEAHVGKMRKNATYGGNIELVAFARMKMVDIKVYQPGYIYVIEGVDVKKEGSGIGQRPVMHIAYHTWEHYSSIRNIDGPHEGLPEIKIRIVQQKPLAKLTSQDPPRSIERMIMKVTGVQDLELVRELLEKHHGNVDNVYNEIYEQINGEDKDVDLSGELGDEDENLSEPKKTDAGSDSGSQSKRMTRLNNKKVEKQNMNDKNDNNIEEEPSPILVDSTNTGSAAMSQEQTQQQVAEKESSLDDSPKAVVPTKRMSSREKKELAKRNQKLNRKNKGKAAANPDGVTDTNTKREKVVHLKSDMRELFV